MKLKTILTTAIATGMLASTMSAQAAQYTLKGFMPKFDLDHNGTVNAVDASIVLTEYAATSTGKDTTLTKTEKYLADYDLNDKVNAIDASAILEFYAKSSVASKEKLVQTFINFYAEILVDGSTVDTKPFLTYEECMDYINADKATRKKQIGEMSREYRIFANETNVNSPDSCQYGVYIEQC